jgi:hypothetical protein
LVIERTKSGDTEIGIPVRNQQPAIFWRPNDLPVRILRQRMKIILIITSAILAIGGAIDWAGQWNRPAQPDEIIRAKADQIMTEAYGANWMDIYIGCVKTNRARGKAMTATYESAIGFHPPK